MSSPTKSSGNSKKKSNGSAITVGKPVFKDVGSPLPEPESGDLLAICTGTSELGAIEIAEKRDWEVKALQEWKPGEKILGGLYQVLEKRIEGGMGYVYIAKHKKWNRTLAIKQPNEEMLSDRDLFARILRETYFWVEMGLHPNIAYCYYVRNIEEVPHIFVEYVDGGNLREWIEDGKCIDYRVNLDLAIQFCHGMEFTHSKGMIHRDIKPENVLMTKDGVLKITDFGLVRRQQAISEETRSGRSKRQGVVQPLTMVGCFMGTDGYVAPEQAENPRGVDERADIFSFGVCLYEMFCRSRPYKVTYGRRQKPPNPVALSGDKMFPKELGKVLKKCVRSEPEKRYRSFEEIRIHLSRVYKKLYGKESQYAQSELIGIGLEADGLNNQGFSYWELGHHTKARELFEKAVAKERLHPQANWNLGNLSVLKQSIAHPEWQDVTIEMLRNILRKGGLSEEQVDERVQEALERESFFDGVALTLEEDTTVMGSEGVVRYLAFSPDGQFLATGSSDETVKLWVVYGGELLKVLCGHKKGVDFLVFSLDGEIVAIASDGLLRLWDIKNDQFVASLDYNIDGVLSVGFYGAGHCIAAEGWDKTVKLWEVESGQIVKILAGHTGRVTSVSFSPDCQLLASGGHDKTVRLWNVQNGQIVKTLEGHGGSITSIGFSLDRQLLASGSEDKTVKLWDVKSGQIVKTLEGHADSVISIAFSPDGQLVASASRSFPESEDNTVRLWDVKSGQSVKTLGGDWGHLNCLSFSPDGKFLATGGRDNIVRLWVNLAEPQLASLKTVLDLQRSKIEEKEKLARLKNLISQKKFPAAYDLIIKAWGQKGFGKESKYYPFFQELCIKGKVIRINSVMDFERFEVHEEVDSLAFSPDGQFIATASNDRTVKLWNVKLWDVQSSRLIKTLKGHSNRVISVSFSPDGQLLASGSYDKTVRLWDVKSGQLVRTLEGGNSLSFSPDGQFIASRNEDNTARLWDVKSGQSVKTLDWYQHSWWNRSYLTSVAFSPDGQFIALGNADGPEEECCVQLWNVQSGQFVDIVASHKGGVNSIAFSPDSYLLASGGWNQTVRLWGVQSGESVKTLEGHWDSVTSVAFSPDGQFLASGSYDKTVNLWHVKSGQLVRNLDGHTDGVTSVAFSPDGQLLASGSRDNTVRIWLIIPELFFSNRSREQSRNGLMEGKSDE